MRTIISLKNKQYVISMQARTQENCDTHLIQKKRWGKNLEKGSQIGFQLRSSGKKFRTRALETAEENHNMF